MSDNDVTSNFEEFRRLRAIAEQEEEAEVERVRREEVEHKAKEAERLRLEEETRAREAAEKKVAEQRKEGELKAANERLDHALYAIFVLEKIQPTDDMREFGRWRKAIVIPVSLAEMETFVTRQSTEEKTREIRKTLAKRTHRRATLPQQSATLARQTLPLTAVTAISACGWTSQRGSQTRKPLTVSKPP